MFLCARFIGAIPRHNNGYSTRDDVSHFVYITIAFDRLKNERIGVKFHSYVHSPLLLLFLILSLSMDFTTSFIFASDHEWDRIVIVFPLIQKLLWMWCSFELRSRIYARARVSAAQRGLVISVYTRLKYLRANQILLSSEDHYKCAYAYEIKVQFLELQQQWTRRMMKWTFTSVIRMVASSVS